MQKTFDQTNFEAWRQNTLKYFNEEASAMHYHRVNDALYSDVRAFLLSFVRKFLTTHQKRFVITLNREQLDNFYLFCEQMEIAHMHPRSDSAKFRYVRSHASNRSC